MELNSNEQILWDKFKDLLFSHVNEQIDQIPDSTSVAQSIMLIESSIDMLTELHCSLLHNGISKERSEHILKSVAFLMKKRINDIFNNLV